MECGDRLRRLWRRAGRQKLVGQKDTLTSLSRCLSTLQLTAIGLGSTIGVGIYVLLGVAVRDYAGPGVVVSFLLAGMVVLTNAVIYAEFGSYIPHTGAAYTYMYLAVGELAAFLTGWMSLLSLTCSAATGARAWSGFVDSLFNNSIQTFLDAKVGQVDLGPPFSRSLDWMAFLFFLSVTVVVSCNVRCSSIVNTVLAALTTSVLVFVTVAGPIMGDVGRLTDPQHGGFLPYGFEGVIAGASAAFFAFNGYDSICIAAEEAADPRRSVPRAILIELLIVTVVYCGAAVGTVSLIPFSEIDLRAPIPSAFEYQGVTWARYLVTIGPIIAITNLSILGLYAGSRIAYRMAEDGLLMKKFAYINSRTQVPLVGVIFFGAFVAVISLLLELKDLVRFSVLCMLFQYIVLAPALVSLRTEHAEGDRGAPGDGACSRDNGEVVRKYRDSAAPACPSAGPGPSDSDRELVPLSRVAACVDIVGIDGGTRSPSSGSSGRLQTSHRLLEEALTSSTSTSTYTSACTSTSTSTSSYTSASTSTFSYARAGDLGCGSRPGVRHPSEPAALAPSAGKQPGGKTDASATACGANRDVLSFAPASSQHAASSDVSQSEDSSAVLSSSLLRNSSSEPRHSGSDVADADESHLSEESSQTAAELASRRPGRGCSSNSNTNINMNSSGNTKTSCNSNSNSSRQGPRGEADRGCLGNTAREFLAILTTKRCLVLLVMLLAGLAVQLGLGWKDLKRARALAVVTTALLVLFIGFLCEVVRRRCGPGNHDGFKVPLVPYLPLLSCFLNMLLLVSAADVMGIVEFLVLVALGLIVYVVMVMTQSSDSGAAFTPYALQTEENQSLLSHDENDADSEGSQ